MSPLPEVVTPSDNELNDLMAEYYDNPLEFVLACFPWGEPGPLENFAGPDEWQKQGLREIGLAVRFARLHRHHKETWFCTPQTCKEENSEAFAGQHAGRYRARYSKWPRAG